MLLSILDWAIEVTEADCGNVQLVAPSDGSLRIVAQRGFRQPFLNFFRLVKADKSACSAALNSARRVIVQDVRLSSAYTEPSRKVMLRACVRACQSTPLVDPDGHVLGVVSTHFRAPHRPTRRQLRQMDAVARHAAALMLRRPVREMSVDAIRDEIHDASPTKARTIG